MAEEEWIPLGKEAEKAAKILREKAERCVNLGKVMDDILIDIRTGRALDVKELSRDELEELIGIMRKWNYEKCTCLEFE